jgi:hypothetical protein
MKIKLTLSLLIILGLSSCDDFLSEIPDNRTQLDTPENIRNISCISAGKLHGICRNDD